MVFREKSSLQWALERIFDRCQLCVKMSFVVSLNLRKPTQV